SRPEIKERRGENLRKWREENPEEFYEKCTKNLILSKTPKITKAEKALRSWLDEQYPDVFKYNQFLYSKEFPSLAGKKQIDFATKDKKILIELDGPFHFLRAETRLEDFKKDFREAIELTIHKDNLTLKLVKDRGLTLI